MTILEIYLYLEVIYVYPVFPFSLSSIIIEPLAKDSFSSIHILSSPHSLTPPPPIPTFPSHLLHYHFIHIPPSRLLESPPFLSPPPCSTPSFLPHLPLPPASYAPLTSPFPHPPPPPPTFPPARLNKPFLPLSLPPSLYPSLSLPSLFPSYFFPSPPSPSTTGSILP